MSGWRALRIASVRGTRVADEPGEGLEADASRAQAGDRGDLLLGRVEGGEDADGVAREHLTGLGEADLAAVALDEDGPGALLEAPDHLRDGRLREAQRVGGAREGFPRRQSPS